MSSLADAQPQRMLKSFGEKISVKLPQLHLPLEYGLAEQSSNAPVRANGDIQDKCMGMQMGVKIPVGAMPKNRRHQEGFLVDLAAFPTTSERRLLLQFLKNLTDRLFVDRFDGASDGLGARRPKDADRLGGAERKIPSALPVFPTGILHQLAAAVGRETKEQIAKRRLRNDAFEAQLLRSLAKPSPGRLTTIEVIVRAGEARVISAQTRSRHECYREHCSSGEAFLDKALGLVRRESLGEYQKCLHRHPNVPAQFHDLIVRFIGTANWDRRARGCL